MAGSDGVTGRAVRSLGHRRVRVVARGPVRGGCAGLGVMVARVYVSSTVADLRQERRAVLEWLRLARHQAVDS